MKKLLFLLVGISILAVNVQGETHDLELHCPDPYTIKYKCLGSDLERYCDYFCVNGSTVYAVGPVVIEEKPQVEKVDNYGFYRSTASPTYLGSKENRFAGLSVIIAYFVIAVVLMGFFLEIKGADNSIGEVLIGGLIWPVTILLVLGSIIGKLLKCP